MPIYEYVCTDCGEPLEKLQKLSAAPLTDCPACGQASLKRKVSAAGFRLAGGGWYETDFKSDHRRNLSGGGKEEAGSADSTKSSESSAADASSSASASKKSADGKAGSSGGESKSSDSKSGGGNRGQTASKTAE